MVIGRKTLGSVRYRVLILALVPVLSFLTLFTPMFTQNASALTYNEVLIKARAWAILNAVVEFRDVMDASISTEDANKCHIFGFNDNDKIKVGHYTTGDNIHKDMAPWDGATWNALENNVAPANAALAAVGIQGGCRGLLETLGYEFRDGSFRKPGNFTPTEKLRAALLPNAFYGAQLGDGHPGDAIAYVMLYYNLTQVCGWQYRNVFNPNSANNDEASRSREAVDRKAAGIPQGGHFKTYTYENGVVGDHVYFKGNDETRDIYVGINTGFAGEGASPYQYVDCGEVGHGNTFGAILEREHKYADAYAALIKPGGNNTAGTCLERYPGDDLMVVAQRQACDAGFKNKTDANYCNENYDQRESPELFSACKYGQTTATGDANSTTPPPANEDTPVEDQTSCAIPAIGWIICPVLNFMANLVDASYAFLQTFLEVRPLTGTDESRPIYDAWSTMRNIANVAFVAAFMFIVFSQITSVGISNYGIKKLLPRLIVAAILVNISFWVCAIAVDISNILGNSLKALFDGLGASINLSVRSDAATGNDTWVGLVGTIIGVGGAVTILMWVGLSVLVPLLAACLAAALAILLTLIIRQVLIILLIVVSPLAFVAYLLPNTESLFKKWRDLFQVLLLLYPIISLLYGASALAAKIIQSSTG